MKSLFYVFILLFNISISNAQTETTTWNYQLDNIKTAEFQVKNQTKIIDLKTQNIYRFRNQNYFLGLTLKKLIEEGKLTVYKDKDCQKKMTVEEAKAKIHYVHSLDTIISFHPETFAEDAKVVENWVNCFPIEETIYELEQHWNFKNYSSLKPIMSLTAIHISHYELSNTPNTDKKVYLFSIKMEDLELLMDFSKVENQSVIWAKYIEYDGNFENDKIKEKLFTKLYLLDNKVIGYFSDTKPYNPNNILTKSEIETIGVSTDTIITFHPETFKETMRVIRNELNLDDIKSFRVAQELYFDTNDYTFKNKLLAIAPIRKVYDDNGNFKYQFPMFWIVYDDDFLKWLD